MTPFHLSKAPAIMPSTPILFYNMALSGHSHRVRMLLQMMKLPFTSVEVNLKQAEHKRPSFLALHPFGQVPVIDDNGTVVWDSAAILVYLAGKYGDGRLLPADPVGAAAVQRWLSVAAGAVVNGPMAARVSLVFQRPTDMEQAHAVSAQLFSVLEPFLGTQPYLAAQHLTIADLAMYSYIAHAPEGGITLVPYPSIRAWLARIEGAPGFVPMQRSATGLWVASTSATTGMP